MHLTLPTRLCIAPTWLRPTSLGALLLVIALATTGCSSGGSSQDFSQCGNGRIDSGEQCDDGNLDDHDGCTAVCRAARCGDGAVELGVEQCDQFDLNSQGCDTLGHAGADNALGCTASCQLDLSQCGPAFTPTPTVTPTVFVTPTSTPMPIPCGDGLLQSGQTCAECPEDCEPSPCEPSAEQVRFRITLQPPAAQTIANATLLVAYRSSVISIPGSASDSSVRRRVRPLPPLPGQFTVIDLDYAVRLTARQTAGLNAELATVDFDICTGAPAPSVADLSCAVEACDSGPEQPITGCTCGIQASEP